MKFFIVFGIALIISFHLYSQVSYSEWIDMAKTDKRLMPMFGHTSKSDEEKKADEKMINSFLEQDSTPLAASEHLVKLGFEYLNNGDRRTAMFRFNQAWLVDSTNSNVFWGFGAVFGTLNAYQEAIDQFSRGLQLNPNNADILTDLGTIYLLKYYNTDKKKELGPGLDYLLKAYSIKPRNVNTVYKLSVFYFQLKKCDLAWKYYYECKRLGGTPITDEYTADLMKRCKP